jgi:hypothetical protein
MPDVLKTLQKIEDLAEIELLMTDLYPNKKVAQSFNENTTDYISYSETPVDATEMGKVPDGLKTLINCFHHMPPKKARKILVSAEENQQPILIYEMAENKIPLFIWVILLPISLVIVMLMTWFMTPFVRPLTWQQIVFTYLIPIIPICYGWDGQASLPRMYAAKDVVELLDGLGKNNYYWEHGPATKANGKKLGTYIVGYPKN